MMLVLVPAAALSFWGVVIGGIVAVRVLTVSTGRHAK